MIAHGSLMTSPKLSLGFPSSPLFALVYQWEAGFLQGATLSPGPDSISGTDYRQDRHSLVYEAARSLLRGTPMKFVGPVSRMFLFQGFPHLPFSLGSLAVRVSRRWLSRSAREPLAEASSQIRFRIRFRPSRSV